MIAYQISGDGNVSLILGGKQFYVAKGTENHETILDMIRNQATEEAFLAVLDVAKKITDFVKSDTGDVSIDCDAGSITYKGEELHNTVTERIFTFMKEKLPVKPLVNFLEKIMENPSFASRRELYDFLEHKSLPLCEDGDFLAYKAVKNDFTDKYSGKFDNHVGKTVSVVRYNVDDDRTRGCSNGLHAGTLEYVSGFGGGDDKFIIVKVNPKDVVSVPSDSGCQKLRTCSYLVVDEYKGELTKPLYNNDASEYDDDDDRCDECGELTENCTCIDDNECSECGNQFVDCSCPDRD